MGRRPDIGEGPHLCLITHYEVRRELLRAGKAQGLLRLEEFTKAVPGRYLPLTDNALQLAA